MRFGREIKEEEEKLPEFAGKFMNYKKLKKILKKISREGGQFMTLAPDTSQYKNIVSLTVPRPEKADAEKDEEDDFDDAGEWTEAGFFDDLDKDIARVHVTTKEIVDKVRLGLKSLSQDLARAGSDVKTRNPQLADELDRRVQALAQQFLRLEAYVNINFTGFYKIVKKHDKVLPGSPPCRSFYMTRLHARPWVRGDYSEVMVTLSQMYSQLRHDPVVEEKATAAGSFVRSTKKYWVEMKDVANVKFALLQHLPVFLQKTMDGHSDSQLVNSVYLDNSQLELYHGRMDKLPGAIAIRLRWYGQGPPKIVFVERKTHRDAWTGDVSVKERFIVKEEQVMSVLGGTYPVDEEEAKLREKGKSDQEIADWRQLVDEMLMQISSKKLVPTVRTQCMRTAFQIPFDATVRVSLDTNLCMILDRDPGVGRWYRDPAKPLLATDITRFPHAILEVKLQVEDESKTPQWIAELLQAGGPCHPVHKFSKFTHGVAALLHQDVQSVPYWIDDPSIKPSLEESGAGEVLQDASSGANAEFAHLLPFAESGDQRRAEVARVRQEQVYSEKLNKPRLSMHEQAQEDGTWCCGLCGGIPDDDEMPKRGVCDWLNVMCCCGGAFGVGPEMSTVAQRVEPKVLLANERTFIHWLHMAVNLATVSTAVLAFTSSTQLSALYAMAMLPVALLFIGYSTHTYLWRLHVIRTRVPTRWDNPWGPLILGSALAIALTFSLGIKIWSVHTSRTTFSSLP